MGLEFLTQPESDNLINPKKLNKLLDDAGVAGMLIMEKGGVPLIIRQYGNHTNPMAEDKARLFAGFVAALDAYAAHLDAQFTDSGLGNIRVVIKRSASNKYYCLFLREKMSRQVTPSDLMIIVDIALREVMDTFELYYELARASNTIMHSEFSKLHHGVDMMIYESWISGSRQVREEIHLGGFINQF